jgi:hypothetical protein
MAELVDALVSGTSISNYVQVRVLFRALFLMFAQNIFYICTSFIEEIEGPGGEIGRHASLRGWCSQGRAGSSPVLGTKYLLL